MYKWYIIYNLGENDVGIVGSCNHSYHCYRNKSIM